MAEGLEVKPTLHRQAAFVGLGWSLALQRLKISAMRAPHSGVKANVFPAYFKAVPAQGCILYWIHAADRVFEAICLRFVALGSRLGTQTPAWGAAWQVVRRIAVGIADQVVLPIAFPIALSAAVPAICSAVPPAAWTVAPPVAQAAALQVASAVADRIAVLIALQEARAVAHQIAGGVASRAALLVALRTPDSGVGGEPVPPRAAFDFGAESAIL